MKWPDPVIANYRALQPDLRYQKISKALYSLRALEIHGPPEPHALLCRDLLKELMKKRDFVADASFWIELYLRQTLHYPHLNSLRGIPFVNVTKHNHALSWYMTQLANSKYDALPLIHFDSHHDANDIRGSRYLSDNYKKFKSSGDHKWIDANQNIVHDIGAAMSGILLTTGIRPFFWVSPHWLTDREVETRYFITDTPTDPVLATHVTSTKIAKELKDVPLVQYLRLSNAPSATYAQLHDPMCGPAVGKKQRWLFERLKPFDHFILDVDLDYFVCNGDADASSPGADAASPNRTPMRELITEPRNVFAATNKEYGRQKSLVAKEVNLIDGRIRNFARLMRLLNKAGKTPALISVSDSTGVDFTACEDCASVTNQYVSSNLALYVRTKVLSVLESVL